ncbi:MAG TPA: metal-dependent hydrolase [Bryobacteraceae bacterium]|jgi:inner membrane protein|nr:metal-dependent hydrolase [Bryobacteraceae bacterium]
MDPLTHTATGWFLNKAGLGRLTPQGPVILLLAANAPDIDIVTTFGGSLTYLEYHRHLTHALLSLPLMAFLPVLLVRLVSRRPVRWLPAFLIAAVAVATHLALDATNIYGIRLLLPFSSYWFSLDTTPVVDIWIWAACALALLGPLIARLVNQEIGATFPRGHAPGRGFALFALLFLVLYNGGRAVLHQRAVATMDARLYNGSPPLRVAAFPDPFQPFRWRGVAETPAFFALADLNLLGQFDPGEARILYKPQASPALTAAASAPAIRGFLGFAQWPFWRALPAAEPENGTLVEVFDLRFSAPPDRAFVADALLSNRFEVVKSSFHFGATRPR